ncbi:MAG: M48 family metalloprotease [Planctomycetota bacterium]|nr:MAG: M48 family metalloprotease [Planctomycetota bacterium]
MYFVVFAAFVIILSVPEAGPPWSTINSPVWRWIIVLGQIPLTAIVGYLFTRSVIKKLELEPAWLQNAQKKLNRGNLVIRLTLTAGIIISIYLTDWVVYVRALKPIKGIWGMDEIIALLPFFAAIFAGWLCVYPADRAVRQVAIELQLWLSIPARPVWRLRRFLSFMFRHQVMIIAAPMIPIVIANDFAHHYGPQLRRLTGLAWGHEAVLVIIAGGIFLFAPVMLRYIWHTRALPSGELRQRLENLCRRARLTYRQILIWESDGMVVNAAVMGLFGPLRYILLSDGLLEMMEDKKIEAVFGHEIGHIKYRHIQFYLLFAILSMLIVGGITELMMRTIYYWSEYFEHISQAQDYLHVLAMVLIVMVWGLGFGGVSRRFEWQSDLFGARSVTPSANECNRPCFVHDTALTPKPADQKQSAMICATGAATFADSLHRIAILNGIPIEARSWRHSSISHRMQLLKKCAQDPTFAARLERSILIIKITLLIGTLIGLAIAVWLYWPTN